MTNDFFSITTWYIVLLTLGLLFLPLTHYFFKSFFDYGYAFAKVMGLLLISYTIWILGSFHILTFNQLTITLVLGFFVVLNTWLILKNPIITHLKQSIRIIIFEELLFLSGLILWSVIKGYEPSIYGLEKYMDFGFINSILRSEYFPPKDMWMAPLGINYYYFGHLTAAVLIKITGVFPAIGYNLVLATLFALCLSCSFSIGANLYWLFSQKKTLLILLSGLISAFLVTLAGNLHTIYVFFTTYIPAEKPVPFWDLEFKWNASTYWYPNATRFIPNTIHEFPIYSFVVSDLHGHVLDIPFVLLFIALSIKIFFQRHLLNADYLLLSLLLGVFLMTNVLDGPIYLLYLSIVFFFYFYREKLFIPAILHTIKNIFSVAIIAVTFSLPFWLNFTPFASGIGVLCAPDALFSVNPATRTVNNSLKLGPFLFEKDHCNRSPLWMLLILWGFPLLISIKFILSYANIKITKLRELLLADYLVLGLISVCLLLIIIPEIVYVKDIYPDHYRANTVFKFGYQAFIIFGLISGYMITKIFSKKPYPVIFSLLFTITFILVAIYPYFAVKSYFNNLQTHQGLNGLQYLERNFPTDYLAINWINKTINKQPVILEAHGDSYTDYARVSANTGLPTVIGWTVHEWLWRGSYEVADQRIKQVTTLYESTDIEQTKQLIKQYNIQYIYIGSLERQKYTKLNEAKFYQLGHVVFEEFPVRIFKIN